MVNNIVTNFHQVLHMAKEYDLPPTKRRAIIREYLQSLIVQRIYADKLSSRLFFVGGTSLRLLHGLGRFSEDLDFDCPALKQDEITRMMHTLTYSLQKENIEAILYTNTTSKRTYFELRFKNLLYDLAISADRSEKLMIKFDFERFWKKEKREIVFFNHFGCMAHILTIPKNQILVQKLYAYLHRKQTLGRDLYDIVWLIGLGVTIDHEFLRSNKITTNLMILAQKKFHKEQPILAGLQRKLKPFLFDEKNSEKCGFFGELIASLQINSRLQREKE